MTADKIHDLWGQDFRIVPEGLAETDVVVFVEKLMSQHRESLRQLDHVAALRELATDTVEEAESLASVIKANAKKESEAESARIIAEATDKARLSLGEAERARRVESEAAALTAKAAQAAELRRQEHRQRIREIKSSLKALKESAIRELSTRMPSQYIGKHLYQSVHFLPAFESFIKRVEAELERGEVEEDSSPNRKSQPK